jgi:uncharacterized membrane protein HdeD (DUF308 family)
MSYISSVFAAGIEGVRKSWSWFFACGIVLIALGAMCVVKDQTATTFSILALGWVLMISAVVWFVNSFQAWTAFAGVVSAVLGISLLIAWPTVSTYFVGMIIGIDLVLDGAALLGLAAAIHSLPVPRTRTA